VIESGLILADQRNLERETQMGY